MYNWAGSFKHLFLFLFFFAATNSCFAKQSTYKKQTLVVRPPPVVAQEESKEWIDFALETKNLEKKQIKNGISYIISGSLALVGGILGDSVAADPAEKGIYAIFQTIGVASIGYGAYTWQIGGEERTLYQALQGSNLNPTQKADFLESYKLQRKLREKNERVIKAITHGLIAGLNIYNASRQQQETVQSALYFVGGVNLLAAVSYTFEF